MSDIVNGRLRSEDEARANLRKHLGFIQRSCDLYDAGFVEEAERIAVSLRVLFHSTQVATSLVNQLGMSGIELPSSRDPADPTSTFSRLIRLGVEVNTASIFPRLSDATFDSVPLQEWWAEEPLSWWDNHTRRGYVLSLANKDGAHFDPNLTMDDEVMRTFGHLELKIEHLTDGKSVSKRTFNVDNAAHASVRQIAYEVLTATAFGQPNATPK